MTVKKHEWRKREKQLYMPRVKPELIHVPALNFLTIKGEGNPNSEPFAACVKALYTISYAIKMLFKKEVDFPEGYVDYTVYPLEGVYDLNEKGREKYDGSKINKNDLVYTLMIRQPDFVDEDYFLNIMERTKKRKTNIELDRLTFERIEEGPCIQMLHVGSFDDEPATFEIMEEFANRQHVKRKSKKHREIYLNDFRKVPAEKLKTVLRFQLKAIENEQ